MAELAVVSCQYLQRPDLEGSQYKTWHSQSPLHDIFHWQLRDLPKFGCWVHRGFVF